MLLRVVAPLLRSRPAPSGEDLAKAIAVVSHQFEAE
jgi:hypothetical protein